MISPVLVPSSAKRISTQILVIAKLKEPKVFFFEALFVISFVPARNCLFNVSNWSTKIRCENCSRLRIEILKWCHWCHSSVFIGNCKHISNFVLILDFEQANVCWVHIEKINNFEDKIEYLMRYVVALQVWTKFINK